MSKNQQDSSQQQKQEEQKSPVAALTDSVVSFTKTAETSITSAQQTLNDTLVTVKAQACQYMDQGYQTFWNVYSQAQLQAKNLQNQACTAVEPYMAQIKKEKQAFDQRMKEQVLRPDNLKERQQYIFYFSLGVSALTFIALKKRYLRSSIRNGVITYVGASYLACPENLNPF